MEGCGKSLSDGFYGNGMCNTHYRNFRRSGHPLGLRAKAKEELISAALLWADDRSEGSMDALMKAAWAVTLHGGPAPRPLLPIRPEVVAALTKAAEDYAWAEEDWDFDVARVRLEEAAKTFGRSLAVWPGQPNYEQMEARA